MKIEISSLRQSATMKVAIIGLLVLVMLIPIGMINGVINDRSRVAETARLDISRSWGGSQLITGPVLHLSYTVKSKAADGTLVTTERPLFLLAESLSIDTEILSEIRKRGIHEVPVYNARLKMTGRFDLARIRDLLLPEEEIRWQDALVTLGIGDASTVTATPRLTAGDQTAVFETTAIAVSGLPPQLAASIGDLISVDAEETLFDFEVAFDVNGSDVLQFLPLADNSNVTATSNWPSPSFIGKRLPAKHDITDEGFDASWNTTSLGRSLPTIWSGYKVSAQQAMQGAFGVRLVQPVGLYQLMHRALNYAVLFIGLTFITYFMMEIIAGTRLHPLQYLLVGFANALFYLLLLSFAEHIGFGPAYVASALASSTLIVGYSSSVLPHRRQVAVMSLVLLSLYVYLYMTLQAEKYALLAGSVGLWVILGAIMYLTRKIDWYAMSGDSKSAS